MRSIFKTVFLKILSIQRLKKILEARERIK